MKTTTSRSRFIFGDKEYGVKQYRVKIDNPPDGVGSIHVHISLSEIPDFSIFDEMFDENISGKLLNLNDAGEVQDEVEFKKVSRVEHALHSETESITIDIFVQYLKINGVECDRTLSVKDS